MVVILDDKSQPDSTIAFKASYEESNPPPYEHQAPVPTSTPSTSRLTGRKSTNHLEIYQPCGTIDGTWTIDTSLQMPGSPDNKLPGNERPNLSLRTRIGTIDANIELAGGPDRARLITNTFIGTIDARIISPNNQKFDLRCQTSTGTIDICIPRSFHGPVTLKSDLGTRSVSKAVDANFVIFSQKGGFTKGFIGTYDGSGDGGEDMPDWKGDRLYAQTSIGTVDIYYVDEKKDLIKALMDLGKDFKKKANSIDV